MALDLEQFQQILADLADRRAAVAAQTQQTQQPTHQAETTVAVAESNTHEHDNAAAVVETPPETTPEQPKVAVNILDPEGVSDQAILQKTIALMETGATDTEVKTALVNEFEGIEQDADDFIKNARQEFANKVWTGQAFANETLKTAMEAVGEAQQAQHELNKTKLDLHFTKKNKRIPDNLTDTDIARLSEEIKNDMSWLDVTEETPRPEFPRWTMEGTSLYTGLAKPVSDVNSKYPELIWMPAVQVMMNYLHNKLQVMAGKERIKVNMNFFLGEISDPGKFFKSSSCELAHEYFEPISLVAKYHPGLRNSEGKVVIGQASSSEGFGLAMTKVNAKHAVFFNDELGKLASKVGIENSSLASDILSWFESRDYSGVIKSDRQSYAFPDGSYCFGWLFCTTTRGFGTQWPRVAGIASGMPDRMFFLLAPKEPKPLTDEVYVNTGEGALRTQELINQAMDKKVIPMSDHIRKYLRDEASKFDDPRSMNMVYTFALYFAVDLGLFEITEECVDRRIAASYVVRLDFLKLQGSPLSLKRIFQRQCEPKADKHTRAASSRCRLHF